MAIIANYAAKSSMKHRYCHIPIVRKLFLMIALLCVPACSDDSLQKGRWFVGNMPGGRIMAGDYVETIWLDIYGSGRRSSRSGQDEEDVKLIEVRLKTSATDPNRDRYYLTAGAIGSETEIFVWDNRGRHEGILVIEFDRKRGVLTLSNGNEVEFKPGLRLEGQIIPDWGGVENWSVIEIAPTEGDAP